MSKLIPRKSYAQVIIKQHDHILLGCKKLGMIYEGLWTSFGGKLQEGDTATAAAIRQVKEGCGLIIEEEDLTMYGTLDYEFLDKAETMYVHVFLVTHFSGVIKKTDGYEFRWFHVNEIPYNSMSTDDKFWLPTLLKRRSFIGHFSSNPKLNADKLEL